MRTEIDLKSEIISTIKAAATVLLSLIYIYFISSKIPHGIKRLISILPILTIFTLIPLFFSSALLIGFFSFFFTWLSNFKLVLFSFDLGPLSNLQQRDLKQRKQRKQRNGLVLFAQFVLVGALPIKIRDDPVEVSTRISKPRSFFLITVAKIGAFLALLIVIDQFKNNVSSTVLMALYSWLLYLTVDHAIGIINLIVGPLLGFELEPPSHEPYNATCLQDFWGRRWNRMVVEALRHTVYKPGRSWGPLRRRGWGPLGAVMGAFIVSGLMHELIMFYLTRGMPTWQMTWYFMMHGLCVVTEMAAKRELLGRGVKVRAHWALLGQVLTIGWLMGSGAGADYVPRYCPPGSRYCHHRPPVEDAAKESAESQDGRGGYNGPHHGHHPPLEGREKEAVSQDGRGGYNKPHHGHRPPLEGEEKEGISQDGRGRYNRPRQPPLQEVGTDYVCPPGRRYCHRWPPVEGAAKKDVSQDGRGGYNKPHHARRPPLESEEKNIISQDGRGGYNRPQPPVQVAEADRFCPPGIKFCHHFPPGEDGVKESVSQDGRGGYNKGPRKPPQGVIHEQVTEADGRGGYNRGRRRPPQDNVVHDQAVETTEVQIDGRGGDNKEPRPQEVIHEQVSEADGRGGYNKGLKKPPQEEVVHDQAVETADVQVDGRGGYNKGPWRPRLGHGPVVVHPPPT
ncbi:hypothetical protein Drorol1_Dr00014732 [Drosera rotundifolia]